jgi:hypothetical protein
LPHSLYSLLPAAKVETPGDVTVHQSYKALNVVCEKAHYASGEATIESKTKGMAFGNILFGGVIGAGVDVANGLPTTIRSRSL